MFIQTEETPNPHSLKFLPGRPVLEQGTRSYAKGDACKDSAFAKRLLLTEGVTGVYFGYDFITISKETTCEWYVLKPAILGIIMEQFISGLPVITPVVESEEEKGTVSEDDDPIVRQIIELIDTRVRPAVAQDGGDIVFHAFRDGIVYLKMQGACSGCPSSSATLKSGIENMLRYYVPEVLEVRAVE